ncbi:PP2C family protein-serine/threonine phosphatase [Candidatus Cryosericum odellii]|jgi:protein phosphatase|uniref:Serine/threonine-protein phosphatase n=1 Tax=Candidatus Cryosericum odellii TaxID=2290917 RepID=A0A398DA97_9BACT|nr:protein phosphatase 2C domain-containing protein [Candidatus Cryosericum odellii]RIE07110.1 serine/threonine-protein phosphatase [Candidatus Cryosericum odellii]RIE08211.1 serine/threonine-protein phosphatase [Candidatus Cryosericum odellii]
MRFETASRTDIGRSAKGRNEDAVGLHVPTDADVLERYGILLAVADGVGGAPRGDEASRIAVQTLLKTYYEAPADIPIAQRLKDAFAKANAAVVATDEVLSYRHMCTTLVAAVVFPDRAVFANIGDSRGYIVPSPAGAARQITVDHSEVQEMVQQGLITQEQAEVASNRNIITRVVGTDPNVEVDLFDVPLVPGDTVLLCSDGLVTAVTDAEIAEGLQHSLLKAVVDRLVKLAKGPKGHDNVTVCVARLLP